MLLKLFKNIFRTKPKPKKLIYKLDYKNKIQPINQEFNLTNRSSNNNNPKQI